MSVQPKKQNENPLVKQKENGLLRWLGNALIVWVALISCALVFHAFGNTIASFASFFEVTSILVFIIYGLVFAFVYDRISGIWSPRLKRKSVSLFVTGLENDKKRSFSIRLLDGFGFGTGVSIIFWGAMYMISAGLLSNTDSAGVADTSGLLTIVVIAVSSVALDSGGRTGSKDDEDDKSAKDEEDKGG